MMPTISLQEMAAAVEAQLPELQERLANELDFAQVERALQTLMAELMARVLEQLLTEQLRAAAFVAELKALGGRLGMRLKEYRWVRLRLSWGQVIEVQAPYFIKTTRKRGRRKRGPNGRGAYLGLEALGFIERCSAGLVSAVVELALLSPSLAVAQGVLSRRGMELDVKTLRRLCAALGQRGIALRGAVSLDGCEALAGRTLIIGIDGGRLRERRCKRGRRRAEQKRQGYHTHWREPKLLTLYLSDAEGQLIKEIAPIHDATLGDHEALFALLERYLRALPLSEVSRVVFCGDGAEWIWNGVPALVARLGLAPACVYQVIDYTHAKQNLRQLLERLPKDLRTVQREQRWKRLLWAGEIDAIGEEIERIVTTKRRREQALRKWQSYFADNAQRLQYQRFEAQGLPCGSGCVESAIRRVINLRLKAPGTFWTAEMAECFLFLRSQLLSGRWEVMLNNLTGKTANQIKHHRMSDASANENPWVQAA